MDCGSAPTRHLLGRVSGEGDELGRVVAGQMELALQVLLSDFEIAQGHADIFVTEQLHEGGQADAEPEHLRGKGVAQMVRSDVCGNSPLVEQLRPEEAELVVQGTSNRRSEAAASPRIWRAGKREPERAGPECEPRSGAPGRRRERGVRCAACRAGRAAPIGRSPMSADSRGQIDAFSDTDSGGASEQQRIGVQVVGAPQFLLQQLIVFRGESVWGDSAVGAENPRGESDRAGGDGRWRPGHGTGGEDRADTPAAWYCTQGGSCSHSQRNQPSRWGSRRNCERRRSRGKAARR